MTRMRCPHCGRLVATFRDVAKRDRLRFIGHPPYGGAHIPCKGSGELAGEAR